MVFFVHISEHILIDSTLKIKKQKKLLRKKMPVNSTRLDAVAVRVKRIMLLFPLVLFKNMYTKLMFPKYVKKKKKMKNAQTKSLLNGWLGFKKYIVSIIYFYL